MYQVHNQVKVFLKAASLKFIFLTAFYLISKFFVSRIYDIIVLLQSLGSGLGFYENRELELNEAEALRGSIAQISGSLGKLIFYIILFAIVIFLIYVVFESIIWNLVYNGKFSNFKKYFLKFILLSLIFFIVLIPFLYGLLVTSRSFLISYMFDGIFLQSAFLKLIFLFLILVFLIYLVFSGYTYLNKLKFLQSVKEIFKFRKFYLYFVLLIVFLFVFFVIKSGLRISTSIFSLIIQGLLVSIIFTFYKMFLVEKLKT